MAMTEFTQLANGDIWLPPGSRDGDRKDTASNVFDPVPDAREDAIAKAQDDPLRPDMICPWCQQTFPTEDVFNGHVKERHSAAIGLSAEEARHVEESRRVREGAQARVDQRENPTASEVIQKTMDEVGDEPRG